VKKSRLAVAQLFERLTKRREDSMRGPSRGDPRRGGSLPEEKRRQLRHRKGGCSLEPRRRQRSQTVSPIGRKGGQGRIQRRDGKERRHRKVEKAFSVVYETCFRKAAKKGGCR